MSHSTIEPLLSRLLGSQAKCPEYIKLKFLLLYFSLPLNTCTSKVNRKTHQTSTTMSFYLLFSAFKEVNVLLFQNITFPANGAIIDMFQAFSCSKTPQTGVPFECSWMNHTLTHLSHSLFFADFSNFLWRLLLVSKLLAKCLIFSKTCCLVIWNSDAKLTAFSPFSKWDKIMCFFSRDNTDSFHLTDITLCTCFCENIQPWVNVSRTLHAYVTGHFDP